MCVFLSLSVYIYKYMFICVCLYIYIYIYIYIYKYIYVCVSVYFNLNILQSQSVFYLYIYLSPSFLIYLVEKLCGPMAEELDWVVEVNEFELQLYDCVCFRTNLLGKYEHACPRSHGLNHIIAVLQKGLLWQ